MDKGLIYCEWVDSRGACDGWEFREGMEPLEPAQCKTVGFVLDETQSYVTLAMSVSQDQTWARKTIPVCCITRREVLTTSSCPSSCSGPASKRKRPRS